jgi:predicted nucleotidyltransferase
MKLTTKKLIKNLNDRLLTQNIIVQTLIDIILENGLTTEEDLDIRIKSNIELLELDMKSLKNDENPTEGYGIQYTGPIGEA